jgi:RNA-directed DNA polymerase
LTLSVEKTKITHIEEGFDFLGWNFRKYDGKLLIKPSKKNVKAFLKTIRETVKGNKTAKQENLIRLLNPKIRGWANYHKGTAAKETFSKVDCEVWKTLWQWAKRRHSSKGTYWIKEKYFKTEKHRNWIFAANTQDKDGKPQVVKLVNASDTKIERHTKIRGEANPFDPAQETYFESRLGRKMKEKLTGRIKWLRLWWRQDKECPNCHEKITKETGWHVHHILPKSEGGKDNYSNLVLLHPNCHRQIHSQRLEVVKPAPVKGGFVEA